jgi:hypothetical protein
VKALSVTARVRDIALFERLVARGEIPGKAVRPLALVFAAMRKAQIEIGPGHFPLDTVVRALPESYTRNWLSEQTARF